MSQVVSVRIPVLFSWERNGASLVSTDGSQVLPTCTNGICGNHRDYVCFGHGLDQPNTFLFANPIFSRQQSSRTTVEQVSVIVRGKWGAGRWTLRINKAFVAERSSPSTTPDTNWPALSLTASSLASSRECQRGCSEIWFSSPRYPAAEGGFPAFPFDLPNIPLQISFIPNEREAEACIYYTELLLFSSRPAVIDQEPLLDQGNSDASAAYDTDGDDDDQVLVPSACSISSLRLYVASCPAQQAHVVRCWNTH